jgi:aldehyde:ferredoxin oxidoreductase
MGAVLGSKGIKAVVIDDEGTSGVPLADEGTFKEAARKYTELLRTTPQTSEVYTKYGTAAMVDVTNALGGLPTKNFSRGSFEGAGKINGRALYQAIVARGGDPSHACMPGCIIRSSNIYVDAEGKPIVRSLEYETMVMFGPNCGIDNLDELAEINRLCNDIGVDSIDLGGAVGIAMEAGLIPYGDADAVKKALDETRSGTLLGRILGQGGAITGKVLGVRRIPAVKGQVMAAYEPRAIKGHGVTFATSTMGADHTAGFSIREGLDSHERKGQVEASGRMQVNGMIYDSLGVCLFAHVAVREHHELLAEMVKGRWGWKWDAGELRNMAIGALREEREFNRRAGLGAATDRLPEIFSEEVNPSSGTTFDFSAEELDAIDYR